MIMMKFFAVLLAALLAFVASAWSTYSNSLSGKVSRRRGYGKSGVVPSFTPTLWDGHRTAKKGSDESKEGSEKRKQVRNSKTGAKKKSKGDDKTYKPQAGKTTASEPEPHEVTQVPLPVSTPLDWRPLNLAKYSEIQKYLGRAVTAVVLPEMVTGDETYPGLILDGASGVGKTQQAFALLNHGKHKLAYLLLVGKGADTSQAIYRQMRQISTMPLFLKAVDAAIKDVSKVTEQGDDPFGVNYLREILGSNLAALDGLVHFIADNVLKYDQGQNILSIPVLTGGKRTVTETIDCLAGTVLFLDEVLPTSSSQYDPSEKAFSRLRFVRNLGRALGMRVVMAGTAATAANMITLRSTAANAAQESSRLGAAERGWMEVEFLWKPVPLPALLGADFLTNHQERPYLLSLLEGMPQNPSQTQEDIISTLAKKIAEDKCFTNKGKLIWLSGCWLASEEKPPTSPIAIGPADLVKNHFFEPALAVSVDENKPHMGRGTEYRKRFMGPLRIALQRHQEDNIIWWVLLTRKFDEGYSADFKGIESALTNCIQSCLAIEPVLAVILSIKHNFQAHEFATTFSELWKESPTQQTVAAMDGELNEMLMFSALQMACRAGNGGSFPRTLSAADMVKRMWEYLSRAQPVSPPSTVVMEVRRCKSDFRVGDFEVKQSKNDIEYSYGRDGTGDEYSIKDNTHKKTMMPWLVPACSHGALEETIKLTQGGGKSLFSGMGIAGLVPGETKNSSFDASAYLWESEDNSECAPLDWTFEFKGRSNSYSLSKARDDLEEKCKVAFSTKHNAHAMLVCLTGSSKSECRIWLEGDKLRIVLLVGSWPP